MNEIEELIKKVSEENETRRLDIGKDSEPIKTLDDVIERLQEIYEMAYWDDGFSVNDEVALKIAHDILMWKLQVK